MLDNSLSPRKEVEHQVANQYFNESVISIRVGEMKLTVGNPGDARWIEWPEPSNHQVPLGLSGAVVEAGTDHVRAPGIPAPAPAPTGHAVVCPKCFVQGCTISGYDVHSAIHAKDASACQAVCAAQNQCQEFL